MYDTENVPAKSAPGAECVTVSDGKITDSRFIFDRRPFDAARQDVTLRSRRCNAALAGPGEADVITGLAGRRVRQA
jgi:hypothetical protein